jgi:predicted transcriptional regulator
MYFMHVRTRRNKINIIKSVLLAVQEEVPKTRIMNSANLNHKSVTSYLSSLIDSGFIEMTENKTFIITQDGRNLLHKI